MVMDFLSGRSGPHSGDATRQQRVFLVLVLGVALFAASATHGQEQDQNRSLLKTAGFEARHTFSVGAMPLEADASILAATEALPPAEITLEDLGVDDSYDSFFLEYRYRLGSRWSTFVGAYRFSSSGGREISRDLNYDGVEFSAGADVRAELTADAYMVDLLYSVYKTDTFEVQLGGGLHAFDLNAEIRSEVFVGDANATVSQAGETLLAPIPNFRGSASWALSERFGFTLVGGWLSANIDEFEGDFTYAHLRGHYRVSDNFGVSLGYLYNEVDVTENRERGDLVYDIIFKGPSITLTFGF